MVVGTPAPIVNWYVNGELVRPNIPDSVAANLEEPLQMTVFDGLLHHLELRQCRPEQSGIVTVEAVRADVPEEVARLEPNSVVTASANLQVTPVPKIPQLRPVPRQKSLEEAIHPLEKPKDMGPPMKPPAFTTVLYSKTTLVRQPTV